MNSSLCVFPYCQENKVFTTHSHLLREFTSVCTSNVTNLHKVIESGTFGNVFLDYHDILPSVAVYQNIMEICAKKGLRIFATRSLINRVGNCEVKIEKVLENEHFSYVDTEDKYSNLFDIEIPVIVVLGAGDYCDKFSIQLTLKSFFEKEGYRVWHCGTKEYSALFGSHSFPSFMFSTMQSSKKIRLFNRFVYQSVTSSDADLAILGIPGGIMQENPFRFSEFGEMAYLVSNAIQTDITILSTYAQVCTEEFVEKLQGICQYKFNFPLDYIHLTPTDSYIGEEDKRIKYLFLDEDFVAKNFMGLCQYKDTKIFSGSSELSMYGVCQDILKKLVSNI